LVPVQTYKFGNFELDRSRFELRRDGRLLKVERIPLELLLLLAEKNGNVVSRQEIIERLWGKDVFVDTEHGINTAIRKIRTALREHVERPRFIQTVSGKGYRFVPETLNANGNGDSAAVEELSLPTEPLSAPGTKRVLAKAAEHSGFRWLAAAIGLLLLAAGVMVALNVAGLRDRVFAKQHISPIHSIAVLPLVNLSGDSSQDYFADGMTEALIADLGQIGALRVISRTSMMHYKGTQKTLPEIARELGVDAVAEGSVEREGSRVRITAQLIEAKTDRHLWAHTYDRDLTSVLTLQGEVARAIANEIKIKVTPEEQARLARARTVNPEANEFYLVGRYFLKLGDLTSKSAAEDVAKAIGYFQKAIEKDPSHAPAHAALAEAYVWLGETTAANSLETFSRAKAEAAKAVELDDTLAEGHASLAAALAEHWEWATAGREFDRALELNPNSAAVHAGHSDYLAKVGRPQAAIAEAKLAAELDPLSLRSYFDLGLHYYNARQYDLALEQTRKIRELDPYADVQWLLGVTYREKGMYEEAIREFQKMGGHPYALAHLGNAYARAGRVAEARETISNLKDRLQKESVTYGIALVYAGLGETDEAFAWLKKAYIVRDKGLTYLRVDPPLDPLHSDPRFRDLVRRVGLTP
jgi:TolB-like protein/DNA-binding winged helix-turn-helix (wHTH) protein/Tfp pilus assembly protein PilF